jgi:hypothetical protein
MRADGPPFRVGVDEAVELPARRTPIADAGPDQLVIDTDGDGFAAVTVNGTQSTTPTGSIVRYTWTNQGDIVATQPVATLSLPEGEHYLRLHVTNTDGRTDTDGLRIEIRPHTPHGDNLVRNPGFEAGTVAWQITGASIVAAAAHTGLLALRISPLGRVRQRIPITPTTKYRISAWVRRATLLGMSLRLRAVFVDHNDNEIATSTLGFATSGQYAYREGTATAPNAAVAMDVILGGSMSAPALVDDLRVLDDNLLANPGFETRAPNGRSDQAPGWRFESGRAEVVTDAANVRSGARAVALQGHPTDYRQVTQEIRTLPDAAHYRISAWLKTTGLTVAPTLSARFDSGSEEIVAQDTSEGTFRIVDRVLDAPPGGATRLTLRLHLEAGADGVAYFDDLLVIPMG